MGRRGTRAIEDNYRLKSQEHRFWELKGRIVHCGECGRRMVGHSVFFTCPGQRQYFHYVCTKEGRGHAKRCPNKGHRAELLEDRVAEAVTDFMGAPDQLEKIEERRSDASGKPPAIPGRNHCSQREAQRLLLMRHSYQDKQAVGLMTLGELADMLSELDAS